MHAYRGEPVPSVNVGDFKSVWAFYQDIKSPLHQGAVDVDSIIEHACSPGANIGAILYRCMMLRFLEMMRRDLLSTWEQNGQFQDAVFRVVARIPMNHMGEGLFHHIPFDVFDVETFFEELRKESP